MELHEAFLFGAAGGILSEAPFFLALGRTPRVPTLVKRLHFWLVYAAKILVGGFFAWVFARMATPMNEVIAIQIGLVWPLLLAEWRRAGGPRDHWKSD